MMSLAAGMKSFDILCFLGAIHVSKYSYFLKNLKLGCTIISIGFYGVRVQLCAVLANHFLIEDQLLIRQQMNQRIFYKIS